MEEDEEKKLQRITLSKLKYNKDNNTFKILFFFFFLKIVLAQEYTYVQSVNTIILVTCKCHYITLTNNFNKCIALTGNVNCTN